MKKIFSFALAIVVLLSCTTVLANAAEQEYNFEDNLISLTVRDTRYEVTLEKLSPYGVVNIEKKGLLWYILTLDEHDHQNVLEVIYQIRALDDGYMCTLEPVYIEEPEVPDTKVYLYKDKFIEYEVDIDDMGTLDFYDELYYHIDDDGNIDWTLLYADTSPFDEVGGKFRFADRIIVVNELSFPFTYKYGVYDVKEDKFVAIDEYIDYTKYEGLEEYVNTNLGHLVGDADNDNELSVLDATMIQMCIAELSSHKEKVWINDICDMDCDCYITVMDATAIQLKLAKLEF